MQHTKLLQLLVIIFFPALPKNVTEDFIHDTGATTPQPLIPQLVIRVVTL